MKDDSANLISGTDPSELHEVPKPSLPRAIWNRWTQMARALGVVQTRFLLVGFFLVVVLPTGLFVRATGDRLRLKPPKGSNWVPLDDKKQDLDAARRQF
jgi:hypothetical protein